MTGSRLAVLFAVSLLSSCARDPGETRDTPAAAGYERRGPASPRLAPKRRRAQQLTSRVYQRRSPLARGEPCPELLEVRDAAIHGDRRPSLLLETPAKVSFRTEIPRGGELRFGLAVRQPEVSVEIKKDHAEQARGRGWRSHSSRGLARRKRLGRASHRPQPLRWAESRARALRRRSTRDGDSRQPRGGGSGVACGGEKAQRTGLRGRLSKSRPRRSLRIPASHDSDTRCARSSRTTRTRFSFHPENRNLDRVRRLAERLGLSDRVQFRGFLPPPDVAKERSKADVFVIPLLDSTTARVFTSPLKLLEAMASGRAVVASDLPSLREVLKNDENALLVPPGEPQALAAAIQRLAKDPEMATRLAARAIEDVKRYSWEERGRKLSELLTSVVG